jgi:hypothetical protein
MFELMPEVVGTQDKRDVVRAFEISLANDAGFAMGGTIVVGRSELIEAENAVAALGEALSSCTAHRAEANNDGVKTHAG